MNQKVFIIKARAPEVHVRYRAEWFHGAWYVMAMDECGQPLCPVSDAFLLEHEAKAAARKMNGQQEWEETTRDCVRILAGGLLVFMIAGIVLLATGKL